jgi:hypothetical protein
VRYTAVEVDRKIAFVASGGPLSTTAVLSFDVDDRGTAVGGQIRCPLVLGRRRPHDQYALAELSEGA